MRAAAEEAASPGCLITAGSVAAGGEEGELCVSHQPVAGKGAEAAEPVADLSFPVTCALGASLCERFFCLVALVLTGTDGGADKMCLGEQPITNYNCLRGWGLFSKVWREAPVLP